MRSILGIIKSSNDFVSLYRHKLKKAFLILGLVLYSFFSILGPAFGLLGEIMVISVEMNCYPLIHVGVTFPNESYPCSASLVIRDYEIFYNRSCNLSSLISLGANEISYSLIPFVLDKSILYINLLTFVFGGLGIILLIYGYIRKQELLKLIAFHLLIFLPLLQIGIHFFYYLIPTLFRFVLSSDLKTISSMYLYNPTFQVQFNFFRMSLSLFGLCIFVLTQTEIRRYSVNLIRSHHSFASSKIGSFFFNAPWKNILILFFYEFVLIATLFLKNPQFAHSGQSIESLEFIGFLTFYITLLILLFRFTIFSKNMWQLNFPLRSMNLYNARSPSELDKDIPFTGDFGVAFFFWGGVGNLFLGVLHFSGVMGYSLSFLYQFQKELAHLLINIQISRIELQQEIMWAGLGPLLLGILLLGMCGGVFFLRFIQTRRNG